MEGGAKDMLSQMGWGGGDLTHPQVPAHPSDSPSALVHSCFPVKRGMSLVDWHPSRHLLGKKEGLGGGVGGTLSSSLEEERDRSMGYLL